MKPSLWAFVAVSILALNVPALAQSAAQITLIEHDPISAGGTTCFRGSGFGSSQGNSIITVNNGTISALYWSDTRACITIPSNTTLGTAGLQVTTAAGSSNVLNFTVTGQPTITSITPGGVFAGSNITIAGTNFGAQQYSSSAVQYNSNVLFQRNSLH